MMDSMDDTERWAVVAAEELALAFESVGIEIIGCAGDAEGEVSIAFRSLADAEAMMTLAFCQDHLTGGVYDRATASCVSLENLVDRGEQPGEHDVLRLIRNGWRWAIHPSMRGRRMGWHVSVDLSTADANHVTAALHAERLGGAL